MATPKSAAKKDKRVNLRIEERDRALISTAARAERETLSHFLVESARERAERVLANRTSFAIDEESYEAIMAAIDRPAEVQPGLVKLFQRDRPE